RLGGDYRRLLQWPRDFAWEAVEYRDPMAPLIHSDLDKLKEPFQDIAAKAEEE
ncbi:unnamed protein product, partial [Heterosigma akashiwo]